MRKQSKLISKQNGPVVTGSIVSSTNQYSEEEARIIAGENDGVTPEEADIDAYFELGDDGWYYKIVPVIITNTNIQCSLGISCAYTEEEARIISGQRQGVPPEDADIEQFFVYIDGWYYKIIPATTTNTNTQCSSLVPPGAYTEEEARIYCGRIQKVPSVEADIDEFFVYIDGWYYKI